jgi:tight adherence protein B
MILILVFGFSMLVTVALVMFGTGQSASQKVARTRLSEIVRKTPKTEEKPIEIAVRAKTRLSDRISAMVENRGFSDTLERLIIHAGADVTVGQIVLASVGIAALLGVGVDHFIGLTAVALPVGAAGAFAPTLFLMFLRGKRVSKFNEALPDAIDLMSRALRAGHSLTSSIEVIAVQSPQPLGAEFALCFQQQKFGVPFREAILAVGERVPSDDLQFFITAMLVQKETGGDLTDILDRTTRLIRERLRIQGEIMTHTAQGRLTGWILSLMPIGMLLLLNLITPGYSDLLFHHPLGQKLLMVSGVMIMIGAYIISRIVDIQV